MGQRVRQGSALEAENWAVELVRSQGLERLTESALAEELGVAQNTLKYRGWSLEALVLKRLERQLGPILSHFDPSGAESRERGSHIAAGARAIMGTDVTLPQFDRLLLPTSPSLQFFSHSSAPLAALAHCQFAVMRAFTRQRESTFSHLDQNISHASRGLAAGILKSGVHVAIRESRVPPDLDPNVCATLKEISTRSLRGVTTTAIAARRRVHRIELEANRAELICSALTSSLELALSTVRTPTSTSRPSLDPYLNALMSLAHHRAEGILILDRKLLSPYPELTELLNKLFRAVSEKAAAASNAGYLQPMFSQAAAVLSFAAIDGAYGLSEDELATYLNAFFFGPRRLPCSSRR